MLITNYYCFLSKNLKNFSVSNAVNKAKQNSALGLTMLQVVLTKVHLNIFNFFKSIFIFKALDNFY